MLENLPIHPVLVHLPLGLVFLLPLVTAFLALLYFRGAIPKQSLLLLTFLHLILVGVSYAALETGENEEERVEKIVSESAIESHEERAEVFMVTAVLVFIVSMLLVLPLSIGRFKLALSALLMGQIVLLVLGIRLGHSGGELVYVHGAAEAYYNKDQKGLVKPLLDGDRQLEKSDDDEED